MTVKIVLNNSYPYLQMNTSHSRCGWVFFLFFTLGRGRSLRTNIEDVDSNYFLLKENCQISVFCYFFILFCLFFSIWP